ncbi:MAG: hypothetical protein QM749_11020 [Aquabacterium sp.]
MKGAGAATLALGGWMACTRRGATSPNC